MKRSASAERDSPTSRASSSIVQGCADLPCRSVSARPDVAVAQPGEPAGLLARKRVEMHAHGFHEHQLAQPSEHARAAGALGGCLGDRQARELA
jgi:hypothetical protein